MKTHQLKILPEYFKAQKQGRKTAEIRQDDGRGFMIGDTLILKEWLPRKKAYTGKHVKREIVGMQWLYQITGISDFWPWVILYTKEIE